MLLKYYLNTLKKNNQPIFLEKYTKCQSLTRLKKIGYFCGMDYASKDVYNFSEYISRYDHSLSVALLTYMLTSDNVMTIAALFHDVATPCFSHVIDYMNGDYEKQESTEENTEFVLKHDKYLQKCIQEDNIKIEDIINFKNYSIVDNNRPKLCSDRLDGIILTGIGWTKNINSSDIDDIISDIYIEKNEFNEDEIGFNNIDIAKNVLKVSNSIDLHCHSNYDNYMMELLANITKYAINKKYIEYLDLYFYNEEELINLLKEKNDNSLKLLINKFENIELKSIPKINLSNVKKRELNPLVNGRRINSY